MLSPIFWMIIGMGIVTYTPRMLPLVVLKTDRIPSFIQAVLKNVPYAVLGALIFPGIFIIKSGSLWHVTGSDLGFGLVGGLAAFIVAYLEFNLIFVVVAAILVLSIYVSTF